MGGRIGLPNLRVEIAWGGTVVQLKTATGRAAMTWTDTTSWLRTQDGVTFGHGRSSESDTVTAGSATFTFNTRNAAGVAFDGGNTRQLRTPIRVRWYGAPLTYDTDIDYDDATYTYDDITPSAPVTLWVGTVTDWGGGWGGGVRPFTRVSAVDLVSRFNIQTLRQLPLQTLIGQATTHSTAWVYPLDEESGTGNGNNALATTSSSLGRLSKEIVGTGGVMDFGGYAPGSLSTETEANAATFSPVDASNYVRLAGTVTGVPTTAGGDFGVSLYVLPSTVAAAGTALTLTSATAPTTSLTIGIDASGKPTATLVGYVSGTGAQATMTVTAGSAITTTDWHHLAVTVDQRRGSGANDVRLTLYVNGSSVGTDDEAWGGGASDARLTIPPLTALRLGAVWNGNLANVAAHNSLTFLTALSTSGLLGTVDGGRNGYDNELTHLRFERVMWAAGWQDVSVTSDGFTSMSAMPTRADSLATAAGKIADTEAAPWFIDGQGRPSFLGRGARYNESPAFEIPAHAVEQDTQFTVSDVGLINQMTATRPGGSQALRVNQPSIDAYDEYPVERTLYVRSDTDLEDVAQATVNLKGEPGIRSDAINVDLHIAAASISDVAAAVMADVGTMMRLTDVPTDHGTAASIDYFVEGVQDSVTTSGWKRTFNVSPIGLSQVWMLDSSTLSVLDSTTRLGF